MNQIMLFPVFIPLAAAAWSLTMRRSYRGQLIMALLGSAGAFISAIINILQVHSSGIHVLQLGGWPAPFGISLVADHLSAVMVLVASFIGLNCIIYSIFEINLKRVLLGFYPLMLVLLGGVNGAFLTGDVFNLYVWFEVLLIASFVLLTLGSEKEQIKGAVAYITMNLFASALFLIGVGALYGLTGSLNMAELSLKVKTISSTGTLNVVALLFMGAFGIKAAIFPLFFWLPDSYHTPPVTVSAIFAALLTKVGVYAMIRFFTLIFTPDVAQTQWLLLIIAGITMLTGVLGAASHNDFRRILSFHIVSQIGYMMMGLAIFTPLALAAAVFVVVHNIMVKTNLFLISGAAFKLRGTFDLDKLGGLYRSHPWLAVLFLSLSFSLAGLPPLSGFWGKLMLVKAALLREHYLLVAVSLMVSILTLYSMTKIWIKAFWKPEVAESHLYHTGKSIKGMLYPITIVALMALLIGIYPDPFLFYAKQTGQELMNPASYREAVLAAGSR